mmetsp:Transcript_52576/g.140083  ORF Transcript_52576/g.140083 Transcript_52576/m.140083 type:complete len:138 (-) Transcript_52576:236-649(-)
MKPLDDFPRRFRCSIWSSINSTSCLNRDNPGTDLRFGTLSTEGDGDVLFPLEVSVRCFKHDFAETEEEEDVGEGAGSQGTVLKSLSKSNPATLSSCCEERLPDCLELDRFLLSSCLPPVEKRTARCGRESRDSRDSE